MFYRRRTAWKEAAPPASVPASTAMMASDPAFVDRPYGSHGEMLIGSQASEPPPEPSRELVIEPPPWADQLARGDYDIAALAPSQQQGELSALGRMRLDNDDYEPPAFGPPVPPTPPLQRPLPPPADWRAEERERARPELPLEETPGRYPPPTREAS